MNIHNQLDHLEQAMSRFLSPVHNEEQKALVKKLYADLPDNEVLQTDLEFCAQMALTLIGPLSTLSPVKQVPTEVECSKKSIALNMVDDTSLVKSALTPSGEYILLQVRTQDRPFVVESIIAELKRLSQPIFMVAHCGWEIAGEKQYILQLALSSTVTQLVIDGLVTKIGVILEHLKLAVSDWEVMRSDMLDMAEIIADVKEQSEFLNWLSNDNFIFLGSVKCTLHDGAIAPIIKTKKGVLKANWYHSDDLGGYGAAMHDHAQVVLTKWSQRSIIHRTAHLDMVMVKAHGSQEVALFLGLFTSSVYRQSVRHIPMIREKINQVIQECGYSATSHNYKEMIAAMESFPRGELLQMGVEELRYTASEIMALMLNPRVKVFMRQDITGQFLNCIVMLPEKYFSTEVRVLIEKIVLETFDATLSKRYVQIGENHLARLQLTLKLKHKVVIDERIISAVEEKIAAVVTDWDEELLPQLRRHYAHAVALQHYNKYLQSFEQSYKLMFSPAQAVEDIKGCEEAQMLNKVAFKLQVAQGSDNLILKIYSPHFEILVSYALPVLENLGLTVARVVDYCLIEQHGVKVFISSFSLMPVSNLEKDYIDDSMCHMLEEALEKIYMHSIEDDGLNALILYCRLSCRQVSLIRAYAKFLKQTKYSQSMEYTTSVLLSYPKLTAQIIALFEAQFNPALGAQSGQTSMQVLEISREIKRQLLDIKSINEDRVIRRLLALILSTLRCNFYQPDQDGHIKEYISFKLDSAAIKDLPQPKPYAEIFVYSPYFEGVHLRGGPVARGGLRWSDRPEDFRTEVLGLMKAQMTKNAVIVPVGSKGGFVLKRADARDRDAYMAEGVRCYQQFLRGLLDLTDNIVGNTVVPPKQVVRLDGDDPYLVVAADKGTAAFSDYANAVSQEYGFWLSDAFASGGSVGYDHKKMGITAKGTWVSVLSHLQSIGLDLSKQPITCVGIGDMSGDVFGNGMLFSDNIKLLAAFNHMHIFLDPNPDPKASYLERKRLFDLPRSQWSDYDLRLISRGGGVFERKAKSIALSAEVKSMLGVLEAEMSPDELIKSILKAEVDLLFNGGIGTYVKAKSEANEHIGDKSNDNVRICGAELRAKIVGEGGNLGFTQLSRIEYAAKGGLVNTDFIDNSAGVDCSDHEVNIKIAFAEMLRAGVLDLRQRDAMLASLVDEVAELVLQDNRKQNLILTLEQWEDGGQDIQNHAWLIKHLEHSGELKREIEYLPSDDVLSNMIVSKTNLTRPEISVLMAYAKNSIFRYCGDITWCEDEYFIQWLVDYFPSKLVQSSDILPHLKSHKLRNQIVATMLTNAAINMLGFSFLHQVLDETGRDIQQVMGAFAISLNVLDILPLWSLLENNLDIDHSSKYSALRKAQDDLKDTMRWFLHFHDDVRQIVQISQQYKHALASCIEHVASSHHQRSKEQLMLEHQYSEPLLALERKRNCLGVSYITLRHNFKVKEVMRVDAIIDEELGTSWLLQHAHMFVSRHYIQKHAVHYLIMELQMLHLRIVTQKLETGVEQSDSGFKNNMAHIKLRKHLNEIMEVNVMDSFVSKMVVAIKFIHDIALGR